MKKLSLHEPHLNSQDQKFLLEAFKSTWISGAGKFVDLLENQIIKYTGAKNSVACNSGSSGLFMSLKSLGIKKSYEVIVPTITFIATINSIVQNYASPIFMDCDEQFNIDLNKTIKFLNEETFSRNGFTYNKKTKKKIFALLIVHCFGFPVKLDQIIKICKKKNIFIVEDAAESLGSSYIKGDYKNHHTGTIGDIGIISFNGNKIITGGGGGIIISNDNKKILKIKYLINQAKDDPIKFIHNESGYNLRISNLQSSLIYSQLERLNKIIKKKKMIHEIYKKLLDKNKFNLIIDTEFSKSNYWLNVITLNNNKNNVYNKFVPSLIKKNIEARYVWYPNHLQKPFKHYQNYKINNSLNYVKKSICLPSGLNLNRNDVYKICKIINNIAI